PCRLRERNQLVLIGRAIHERQVVFPGKQDAGLIQNAVLQAQVIVLDGLVQQNVLLVGDAKRVDIFQREQASDTDRSRRTQAAFAPRAGDHAYQSAAQRVA